MLASAIQAEKEVLLKELNDEVTTIYIAGGFEIIWRKRILLP